ncbi:MAG: hypothetical protein HOA29_12985 [Rhodobacteraceae bacterium]|nr:hypothetical protein [Paracoccaceae bacterium]
MAANFCEFADKFSTHLAKSAALIHGAGVKGKAAFCGFKPRIVLNAAGSGLVRFWASP